MQSMLQRKRESRRGNGEEGDVQGTRIDAVRYGTNYVGMYGNWKVRRMGVVW